MCQAIKIMPHRTRGRTASKPWCIDDGFAHARSPDGPESETAWCLGSGHAAGQDEMATWIEINGTLRCRTQLAPCHPSRVPSRSRSSPLRCYTASSLDLSRIEMTTVRGVRISRGSSVDSSVECNWSCRQGGERFDCRPTEALPPGTRTGLLRYVDPDGTSRSAVTRRVWVTRSLHWMVMLLS